MSDEKERSPESSPPLGRRVMALDLGEKRIGVALSDETHLLASSHAVIQRSSRRDDFAALAAIVREQDVGYIVVGFPVQLDGEEGAIARWVRDYGNELGGHLALPVRYWDESFTTKQASASMRQRGTRAREQRGWIDAVAAAFILQSFLDSLERC